LVVRRTCLPVVLLRETLVSEAVIPGTAIEISRTGVSTSRAGALVWTAATNDAATTGVGQAVIVDTQLRSNSQSAGAPWTRPVASGGASRQGPDPCVVVTTAGSTGFVVKQFVVGTQAPSHGVAMGNSLGVCYVPGTRVRLAANKGRAIGIWPIECLTVVGWIDAPSDAVAIASWRQGIAGAALLLADVPTHVKPTTAFAIAQAVLAARCGGCCKAVVLWICSIGNRATGSRTIARLTGTALKIRVIPTIVVGASSQVTHNATTSTGTGARRVAAVSIDTLSAGALGVAATSLPVDPLGNALGPRAMVATGTVGISGARGSASRSAAHVRITAFTAGICTAPGPIALVRELVRGT